MTMLGFQPPFRKDRVKVGGGVCICVSNQLPCVRRRELETDGWEFNWVEIFGIINCPLLIGCCYQSPKFDMECFKALEHKISTDSLTVTF